MMISWILSVVSILAMGLLIVLGANENILQFLGNAGQNIPFVGPWLNLMSGFSRETLDGSFQGTLTTALSTLLTCVSSNILDGIFLGLLGALADHLLLLRKGELTRIWHVGETIVVSLIGVILLYWMKQTGNAGYIVLVALGNIGLLLLGIGIMLRGRFPMLNLSVFLISLIIEIFEAGAGIGLICTVLMIPSMLHNGLSAAGLIIWILCHVLLIVALRCVDYANEKMFGKEKRS